MLKKLLRPSLGNMFSRVFAAVNIVAQRVGGAILVLFFAVACETQEGLSPVETPERAVTWAVPEQRLAVLPPAGLWAGPWLTWVASEREPEGCPELAPVVALEASSGARGGSLSCTPCQCAPDLDHPGAPQPIDLTFGGGATCGLFKPTPGHGVAFPSVAPFCVEGGGYSDQTMRVRAHRWLDGSCAAIGGAVLDRPPVERSGIRALACAERSPKSGTLPVKPPSDDWKICVARDGRHDCPAGYPVQHALFSETEDQRSCGACSCGPDPGSWSVTATTWGAPGCAGSMLGSATTTDLDANVGGCAASGGYDVRSFSIESTWSPAGCEASTGPQTGMVEAVSDVTICCQ